MWNLLRRGAALGGALLWGLMELIALQGARRARRLRRV